MERVPIKAVNVPGAGRLVSGSGNVGFGVDKIVDSLSGAGVGTAFGALSLGRAVTLARFFLRISMRASSCLTFFTKSFTSPGL
jgi:hypothetical protein